MKLLLQYIAIVSLAFSISALSAEVKNETKENVYFTPQEQAWINEHKEVVVGFVSEFPPALIEDKAGSYHGILPDVLDLLTRHTGINFRILLAPSWDEVINLGKAEQIDMLGFAPYHPEVSSTFNVTHGVFQTHFFIYGRRNNRQKKYRLSDLFGKRVAYLQSLQNIEDLAEKYQNITFVPYKERKGLLKALALNDVDFIVHGGTLEYWRQQNQIGAFQIVGSLPILDTTIVMGICKKFPLLESIINKVLAVTVKERRNIVSFWQRTNIDNAKNKKSPLLTKQEQAWLRKHSVIRFSIDPVWAPIEYIGHDGKPYGISLDYLGLLEKILGVKFEFKKSNTWSDAITQLEKKEIDILPATSTLLSKKLSFNFTPSYLSTPNAIFSATNKAYIGGLDKLENQRVVVVKGYAIEAWLRKNYPKIDLITMPDINSALKQIASGKAYAFVGNLIASSYYIGQSGLTQIRVVGETSYTNDLGMAVRKDWRLLPTILHKGLNAIHQNKKAMIYNDWISIQYKHSVDYSLLWQVLGVATIILLSFLYWNRRLSWELIHRRKIEAELYSAKGEAEQATKAKSEFLANMSHEIRTPMNSVIGMGHLLRKTELTKQQSDYIDNMQASSKALLTLIDGILDFSKGEAGKLQLDSTPFSLLETIQQVIDNLETQAAKKALKLSFYIDKDIPDNLRGDPQKIAQILRNFGANAIKFTQSGEVTIAVSLLNLFGKTVKLCFTIKDTGVGISKQQQKLLFKPFSQGDSSISRRYGGTGLGLVINKQLADLMNGKISFDSTFGKGSSFYFKVPLQVCESPIPEDKTPQLSAIPELSKLHVLLVDDDALNCLIAKEFLLVFGVSVTIAENGQIALDTLQKQAIDIVLLDIQMPVLDGYQTIKAIRRNKKWTHLPVIALSAHALATERDKSLAAGMNDYLSKPVDPEQLRNMLLKWSTK